MSQINRRQFTGQLLAAGAVASIAADAQAQAWPAKPIRVIVPYAPGGFTDVTARLIGQKLQERLGQPVTIDNKPGSNSVIGVDALAKSAPDGYTFAVVIPAFTANASLYPKLPYDTRKDLMPVTLIGQTPLLAGASNTAPFKTIPELIAYAKAHPGKVSFGSSGSGSAAHLTTEYFKAITGTYMVHIPYRGAVPAANDLMGGQIELLLDAVTGLASLGKAGKLRLIGVASEKRLAVLPDVPTFIEQGLPGFTGGTWAGILAPAGTPRDIVKRIADEVAKIVKLDDVKAKLDAQSIIPVANTPEEFGAFINAEITKWGKVIKDAKVTLD